MTSIENAEKIRFQRLAKFIRRHFLHRFPKVANACVIDQDIDAAKNTLTFLKHHSYLVFASNVANFTLGPPISRKAFDRLFEFALVTGADEDIRPIFHESLGDGKTDTL